MVLRQAGVELATLAKIVIDRLFSKTDAIPVAVSGGVLVSCEMIRQVFYKRVLADYLKVLLNPTLIDPANGALALARRGSRS